MTRNDIKRRLKLKEIFNSQMKDADFAVWCQNNKIVKDDWLVQWDGTIAYQDPTQNYRTLWLPGSDPRVKNIGPCDLDPDDDYMGFIHVLQEAAERGEDGIRRIPQTYRDQFTRKDLECCTHIYIGSPIRAMREADPRFAWTYYFPLAYPKT